MARPADRSRWTRRAAVILHRWVGLAIAGFLMLLGLTGSVIAFDHEFETLLNQDLFQVGVGGARLSPTTLAKLVEDARPQLRVAGLTLDTTPGHSVIASVEARRDPATGKAYPLVVDQLFVDPATGNVLGERKYGGCCLQRRQLIPFLYELHRSLFLPAPWGRWVTGGVALLWALDCFVALTLTLPRKQPFGHRWRSAWKIKVGASRFRFTFDLHRAGGLWIWGMLLLMAVSAVGLNLKNEVFRPALSMLAPLAPAAFDVVRRRPDMSSQVPLLSFDDIVALAHAQAVSRRWADAPGGVWYVPRYGAYGVHFRTPEGRGRGLGARFLYYDGMTGEILSEIVPGSGNAGDIFSGLPLPVHSGQIGGLPGRIVVCVTGLVVSMLSVTGVLIWRRKRMTASIDPSSEAEIQRR